MAGITGRGAGQIGATQRHIVSMTVAAEVGTVTEHTVAGSHRYYRGRGGRVVSCCDT